MLRRLRRAGACRSFRLPLDALSLDHQLLKPLLGLWSRIHWSSGDGMMPGDQLLAVYRLAATWPTPGDIVELGSWRGLTTSYLAAAAGLRGDCHVYAVDTFCGTKEGGSSYSGIERLGGETLTDFRRRVERAGHAERVTPLIGLTTDMARYYPGRKIAVLLIDADHSYGGVKADFETWRGHMAPGGLMIFHDYDMPDVSRFVDDVATKAPGITVAPGPVVGNVFAVTVGDPAVSDDHVLAENRERGGERCGEPVLASTGG